MKRLYAYLSEHASRGMFIVMLSGFKPLADSQNAPMLAGFYQSQDLPGLINAVFKLALSVGAILAVLRLAYAGFLYMGAADMWGEKAQAKEIIRNAIVGLLLLMSIYIILYQINPDIVSLNVLKDFGGSSGASASTNTASPFSNSTYTGVPAGTENAGVPVDQNGNQL